MVKYYYTFLKFVVLTDFIYRIFVRNGERLDIRLQRSVFCISNQDIFLSESSK